MLDSGEYEQRTGLATPPALIESPAFQGRVISAIYQNKQSILDSSSGKSLVSAEVAQTCGVVDIGGNRPPSIRSLKWLLPSLLLHSNWGKSLDNKTRCFIIENSPDILLPMSLMAGGPPDT